MSDPGRIWTVGHSTLDIESFLALLMAHGIGGVTDVRRFAASRRHPQFTQNSLQASLAGKGIGYLHLPALGGRREPRADSANAGWREPAMRGYADYMEGSEFRQAMRTLLDEAKEKPVAILCAERDWRNCHRGLISDWLKVRGIEVLHIGADAGVEPHPYTRPARIVDARLSYAPDPPVQPGLDLR
jgi:uncharacterized protein (DUF488 family)